MPGREIAIVGGGPAGFFAAITCAEHSNDVAVTVFEKTANFLSKVRISGGGRCNVTHHCFDPAELIRHYPRGGRELLGPFHRFQPADTIEWFQRRGVPLKTESDGRVFPTSDSSASIVDCLLRSALDANVRLRSNSPVERIELRNDGTFLLHLDGAKQFTAACVLIATGGCRTIALGHLATDLGHSLEAPVPSLFSFHLDAPWMRELAGLSTAAKVAVAETSLSESGPLLITHQGVSGPAILRLSAWGARVLHARDYHFQLNVNWLATQNAEEIHREIDQHRQVHGARMLVNAPMGRLPSRLWESLIRTAAIPPTIRWSGLSRDYRQRLIEQLVHSRLQVCGKSLNKEEFVTCGGVRLSEVNFKTMESRRCPGLFFAGEALDIDGVTGGFNFQAAWTTGWIAGLTMAGE